MSTASVEVAGAAPIVHVTAGRPDAEELAVVVAVVTAVANARAEQDGPQAIDAALWARPTHVRRGRARSWVESRLPG